MVKQVRHADLTSCFLFDHFLFPVWFSVMSDVVGAMFSRTFMDELLKPQQLFSHRTTKTVLTRLAHASIMRLNPDSMDRVGP